MKRIFVLFILLFILIAGLLAFRFGSALSQEGNPLPVLFSIMQLELSDSEYEQFAESDLRKRYVSADTGDSRHEVIKEFMKEKGWDFEEQAGSGLIFGNDGTFLAIETRQYSEHYVLWDVPSQFFE